MPEWSMSRSLKSYRGKETGAERNIHKKVSKTSQEIWQMERELQLKKSTPKKISTYSYQKLSDRLHSALVHVLKAEGDQNSKTL